MRLRRIEIRNFRKLVGPVVVDGLDNGLTVIAGDNEEGKSTLLAALKAALFEHHAVGGAIRESMAPLGRTDTPEIALELELGGARYRLRKVFRRGGGTRLLTPTGELRDDAAEQRLQELLRFERRQGRAEPRPEHLGLQALFWVEQGTTFAGFETLKGGRERLARAIEAEIGGVAVGARGQAVLGLVEEELARLVTPRTGRDTGELAEATRRARELAEELERLEAQHRRYQAAVDALGRLREERRRVVEADELGRARESLARVRAELQTIGQLEARRDRASAVAAEHAALWARLDAHAARRRELRAQVTALADRAAAAEAEADAVRVTRGAAERALAAADAAEKRLVDRQAAAEQQRLALDLEVQRLMLDLETVRLERACTEAAAAEDSVRDLKARIEANPATVARLDEAREAERQRALSEVGLRAVATRVEFHPEPGAVARRDGAPLDPSRPLHVTERTELELAPFGRIVLSPGAGELDARRAALKQAEEQVARALGALGAPSLAAAEALHGERRRLETELSVAQAKLQAVLAAEDVEHPAELRDRLAERRTRRERLGTGGVGARDGGMERLREQLAAVDADRQRLARERDAARAETERCAKALNAQREALARQESAVEEISRQRQTVMAQLAAERVDLSDDTLAQQLQDAERAKQEAEADLATLQRQLLAADADLTRERAVQAERRVRQLEEELARLGDAIREQEAELRGLGADAVGERLEECRQRLVLAEDEVDRLRRQARAWRLLRDELQAAASAARDALLAPVRERLTPYLRRLFATADVVLDPETLAVTHLRRSGPDERFEQLSLGTREQIAVLVRLALARLLREVEGEAPCLVLDDALVYADETRFDIMKAILQQAARELQILILTCRPRDYLGLDARQIRLAEQVSPPGA